MKYRKAPRKTAKGKSLLFTFLLLLSLPVFVYGIIQDSNFDIRNQAFDDIEVSPKNPCVISFPNVNPYSLEVGKTVRVQVDALSTTLGVKGLSVQDESKNILLQKTYDTTSLRVSETFTFTPSEAKSYNLSGLMVDTNEKSYACVVSSPYDIKGIRAVANNSKPIFTTTAKESKPSQVIKTGNTYEYTLVATDSDGDMINYFYSFTPGSSWLKPTVIEDGSNGKLTITFKGTTDKPASYLANVFIHDGYSKHLSSQSWVISVSPQSNDNPVVKIIEPLESMEVKDSTPIKITWDASDQNHISKYQLYFSSNPANESTWIKINDNIPYNQNSFNVSTDNIKDGTYRVVLRAVDNQNPPASGLDVSEEIVVARGNTQPNKNDDQVELPEPQIINVSPTSTDEIRNSKPTIKASLIAAEGRHINEETITVKLDDAEVTDSVSFNKISESEYTVIYLPENNLSQGLHKVEIFFKDSGEKEVTKEWTFTIQGENDQNKDSFNIFGYEIAKRTALIIGTGIGLVILAIVIPMIIFAVWKDQSTESTYTNPTLPPTLPSDEVLPLDTPPSNIHPLVTTEESHQEEVVEPESFTYQVAQPIEEEAVIQQAGTQGEAQEYSTYQPEVVREYPTQDISQTESMDVTQEAVAPEPIDDLSQIYSQIQAAGDNNQNNPTPPEPEI